MVMEHARQCNRNGIAILLDQEKHTTEYILLIYELPC
jgi:hypothetical protein